MSSEVTSLVVIVEYAGVGVAVGFRAMGFRAMASVYGYFGQP